MATARQGRLAPPVDDIEKGLAKESRPSSSSEAQLLAGESIVCHHVGPLSRFMTKAFPNRVHPDVLKFFVETVLVPEPMIEKVTLPNDSVVSLQKPFPRLERRLHFRFRRETHDCVKMIRHQQENVGKPSWIFQFVIVSCRGEDGVGHRMRSPVPT